MLLVTAYGRTHIPPGRLAALLRVSKSAAGRIIDHIAPLLALKQRRRFRKDTVLIVDGTPVPTRDHGIAEQSKNCRYFTTHQVVIDAEARLIVAIGRPVPWNRHDSKAWEESGAKAAVGTTTTIADAGCLGTGLVIPHRHPPGGELPEGKREHNRSHKQIRARVKHAFARMKTWKILRDCPLKGDSVDHAVFGIARLHHLLQAGQPSEQHRDAPHPQLDVHLRTTLSVESTIARAHQHAAEARIGRLPDIRGLQATART